MTLAPLPAPLAPATPPANNIVPFLRPPVTPGGPLGPLVPTPVAPAPTPPRPGLPGPLGLLPVVRPALRELFDQPGNPLAGAPDAIDLLDPLSPRNPLNPFSPLWDQAPWNQPDTPASLVPPTEIPTGDYPFPDYPPGTSGFPYTLIFRFPTREWQLVGGVRQVIRTFTDVSTFPTVAVPLGVDTFKDVAGGRVRTNFRHTRLLTGGEFTSTVTAKFALADNPEGLGDLYDSVAISYRIGTDPEEFPLPEGQISAPTAPLLFIPSIPPAPLAPPVPIPLPAPAPDPGPTPQPAPPPVPEEDPIPLIPLPIPLPPQSPELQQIPPPQIEVPANPQLPPTPDYNPTPAPGSDPQTKEPRKLPPVPFDFCELDCLEPEECQPIALLKRVSASPSFSQDLDFSVSTLGQYTSVLPAKIASVNVDVTAFSPNLKGFTSTVAGETIGQFGTLSLVLNGRPIQSYTLNRFQRCVIEVPYSAEGQYTVLVAPIFGDRVTVSDTGERWGFYRVSESSLLPIISSTVLN